MPSTDSRPPAGRPTADMDMDMDDDFDDIFDYDINKPVNDFVENVTEKDTQPEPTSRNVDGLGVDAPLEIARKPRAPRAKLDEERLLSANGIPKLRAKAKKHLKFKGKGHEYSDATRLLSFYQLWLDDLFPKANFKDALAMVEKLGHKKRVQMMRMEWINEAKPRPSVHEDSLFSEPALPPKEAGEREKTASRIAPIFDKSMAERPKTPVNGGDPDMDDLYDATPKASRQKAVAQAVSQDSIFGGGTQSMFGPAKTTTNDMPEEDELDALMAEAENGISNTVISKPTAPKAPVRDVPSDDDLDALLAEEEELQRTKPGKVQLNAAQDEDVDDDDLDALLAEQLAAPVKPKANPVKETTQENMDDDEMEAMADMDLPW